MALEGNLSSFGLAEILQLIAVQQKTGMLTVNNDIQNVVMFFREGQVISTRDRRRKSNDPFRDFVARYGILSASDLSQVAQIAAQSKLDFVDIVSSEGFLDSEDLRMHWQRQIQESMHDVLTWEQCSYKFINNEQVVSGIRSLGEFSVEGLLMESMRRIDEFPQMLEMFPHDSILVAPRGDPAENDELTSNERAIVDLLSDIMSLRDIIAKAQMPLFEVYEALKLLRDKKLITTRDDTHDGSDEPRSAAGSASSRKQLGNPLPVIVALFALALATAIGFRVPISRVVTGGHPSLAIPVRATDALERRRIEAHLRWTIDGYRARNGAWPGRMEDLQSDGLLSIDTLRRARSLGIRYRLTPGRTAYTLL